MDSISETAAWHTMGADQVCTALEVDPATGLDDGAVDKRRAVYGDNTIQEHCTTPAHSVLYKDWWVSLSTVSPSLLSSCSMG